MRLHWHLYVLPFIFVMITLYFTFHLIQGERGIFRLFEVNQELSKGERLLIETSVEKERMEKRVGALSAQSVKADMLDEAARKELGTALPNEYIIYD